MSRRRSRSGLTPLIAAGLSVLLAAAIACSGGHPGSGSSAGTEISPGGSDDGDISPLAPPPELPPLSLRNQDGDATGPEMLRGKAVLLTYIFTRCPMPKMCPATSLRFAEVQERLAPELEGRVLLVSVSFDPEHDTPEVLRNYGERYGADFSLWRLWTGPEDDLRALANAYGFWYEETDDSFTHSMVSAILGPDGSLRRVMTGSDWSPDDAADALRRLAPPPPSEPPSIQGSS